MGYPFDWQKVVEALARELTQAQINLAMANAVIEDLARQLNSQTEEPSNDNDASDGASA